LWSPRCRRTWYAGRGDHKGRPYSRQCWRTFNPFRLADAIDNPLPRGTELDSQPSHDRSLRHLAGRPGHHEVKADFRQLLTEEFGVELHHLDFERRVPEVKGRLDASIGRTVFEAKKNLDQEWADVLRRMPDYLADREREEREKFVGIAADGLKYFADES